MTRGDEDEDDLAPAQPASRRGPKLLSFDLEHLQLWQARNQVEQFVVAIQDSEAFDANVLVEMVDLFQCGCCRR